MCCEKNLRVCLMRGEVFIPKKCSSTLAFDMQTHIAGYIHRVFNLFSAGIDSRRQNLTSTDVRF